MSQLTRPPVPIRLREMLQDYPEHVERLQEVLNHLIEKPAHGVDSFDAAIWSLGARLEAFIHEARTDLEVAEASGNAAAIAKASDKLRLMSRASSRNGGMRGLHELRAYFDANKEFKVAAERLEWVRRTARTGRSAPRPVTANGGCQGRPDS